ncbi:Glycogenin [Lachnellula occidentalis]|uniref:glycogenin glucosyltransferase n=1 Tax=Lachnellula occidentalis TaxID=215460 RepID=A0A8H8RWS8_9HELO|nr:Glycogenin [Lachnellula occidentalis]
MASPAEDVYATLLLSDTYLPGALVLAHSLRDAGTTKKLAVLITEDSVSADAIAQLRNVYDFIVPVERVVNETPANLFLMERADLHSTFTKINLWKQSQFRKIVYVDADIVALRAPDELFDLPHTFSAAPDIGWPDIFNTGLMVLTPGMGEYYALLAMAQRGISFDGADQGLLNMHFKNTFNRLSFTYNVTPSAHYQYLPAYRHFQSSISMAHFIGPGKPWTEGREANKGSTPYNEMVGRWWAVYDRHFRESSVDSSSTGNSTIVQYYTKGEYRPVIPIISVTSSSQAYQPEETEKNSLDKGKEPATAQEFSSWDASRAPPPAGSRPEAFNFPATHYEMSSDPTLFRAPERYPDPPKDMYYQVPKAPTYQRPAPIFPWEKDAPKPTRVFPEDDHGITENLSSNEPAKASTEEESQAIPPVTPTTPTIRFTSADPWQTFTRSNAWDDIPEIERYIGNLQKNRKGNIQVLQGYGSGIADVSSPGGTRHSMRLTDFPTAVERPSLPVTPAPRRKPSFWGEERDEDGELPAAAGVPPQEQWDPAAQLEQLARRQSDVFVNKLDEEPARQIPTRPLPFGSENVRSPAQGHVTGGSTGGSTPRTTNPIPEPSYHGPGAMWEKDDNFMTYSTPEPATEDEKDVLDN